jgi:hypothetical protein
MPSDPSKEASDESFEALGANEPLESIPAERQEPDDAVPFAADAPSVDEPVAGDAAADGDPPLSEVLPLAMPAAADPIGPEVPPRPPPYPVTWKMDVLEAANNSARIQSAANRPEIQAQVAQSPEIETLPLLGADGNRPKTFDEMTRAAYLWESAAVEAIGDPRFTPRLTDRPRNQLLHFSRGPLWADMYLEQDTLRPVLFSGETASWVRSSLREGAGVTRSAQHLKAMTASSTAAEAVPKLTRPAAPAAPQPTAQATPQASAPQRANEPPVAAPSPASESPPAGQPLAFVVGIRNRDQIITRVIQAVAPRIVSDVERVCDEKLDRFRYELWTEERRTGTD